jgi:putative transcriptional regulator
MIRLTLLEALEKKGKSIYWLQQKTGVRYATLHRLATKDVEKVDLRVLEKICRALDCEPGELLKMSEVPG